MTESVLWYVTRGAGIASLIMLTGVVVLGIVTAVRWQRPGWPRFLNAELHRSVSLLTLVFLAIHMDEDVGALAVRRHLHFADADQANARVAQLAFQDDAEFVADG